MRNAERLRGRHIREVMETEHGGAETDFRSVYQPDRRVNADIVRVRPVFAGEVVQRYGVVVDNDQRVAS